MNLKGAGGLLTHAPLDILIGKFGTRILFEFRQKHTVLQGFGVRNRIAWGLLTHGPFPSTPLRKQPPQVVEDLLNF